MASPNLPSLDPLDWGNFRASAHRLVDVAFDFLENADKNFWREPPLDLRNRYRLDGSPSSLDDLVSALEVDILPFSSGNIHPAFFGWVQGTGVPTSILSEIIAATMNSNLGGRNHGLIYLERAVIEWTASALKFPTESSGLLVTGTSQATVLAFAMARNQLGRVLGLGLGDPNFLPKAMIYCGESAHSCVKKAAVLVGIGPENIRILKVDDGGSISPEDLERKVHEDRLRGFEPMALVTTAGTVNTGAFDRFDLLHTICERERLWMHVDGAYGAWLSICSGPEASLIKGMNRADSIALDFHKWMYIQYDCGLFLTPHKELHQETFGETKPSYLEEMEGGLAAGAPWFSDLGIDLSRSARALKVWTALKYYGTQAFSVAIENNVRLAKMLGQLITDSPSLKLVYPVHSAVCVFTAGDGLEQAMESELNAQVAIHLQMRAEVVFSTVQVDGLRCLRAAITNHRTTDQVILDAVKSLERASSEIKRSMEIESAL